MGKVELKLDLFGRRLDADEPFTRSTADGESLVPRLLHFNVDVTLFFFFKLSLNYLNRHRTVTARWKEIARIAH